MALILLNRLAPNKNDTPLEALIQNSRIIWFVFELVKGDVENHSKFEIKSANYINENHTTNNTLNESDTHELEVMLRRTMFLRIITNNLR